MKTSKSISILIITAIVILTGYTLTRQTTPVPEAEQETKAIIATTIPPLAMITQEVVGEKHTVISILPAGASPHTFEATPEVIKKINQATIIFSIGAHLDSWVEELGTNTNVPIVSLENSVTLLPFSEEFTDHDHESSDHTHDNTEEAELESEEHMHDHEGLDPHYWLSPLNAGLMALTIAGQLGSIDPQNQDLYQQNALDFVKRMNTLTEEIDGRLRSIPNRHIVTFHESWNYFVRDFDFEIIATFESSPGKEPTPKELASIQTVSKKYAIPALFSEPQLSPDVIRPFINDLGLKLAVLDPLGSVEDRMTYEDLIRYNARTLYETYTNQSW